MKNYFKGKQYDYRIIIKAIGLYYHFSLIDHDCAKIMRKFSIGMDHTTIYRWNNQYGKALYHSWKKRNKKRSLSKS